LLCKFHFGTCKKLLPGRFDFDSRRVPAEFHAWKIPKVKSLCGCKR
jgi:hypothetical protein